MSRDRGGEPGKQEARDVSRIGDRGSRQAAGEAHEQGRGRQAVEARNGT